MKLPTRFIHFYSPQSDTLDVLLHGGSYDIDSPFMKRVLEVSKEVGHSALAFNFPYIERGDDHSSGPELIEELDTLRKYLKYAGENSQHIRLIGKSLGGIVASHYLDSLEDVEIDRYSVVILGYVTGSLRLNQFRGPISVIQGENDKFGSISDVKKDLEKAVSTDIRFFEIAGADHSYREPNTHEFVYLDKALEALAKILGRDT